MIYRFLPALVLIGLCAALSSCAGIIPGLPFFSRSDTAHIEGSTEPSDQRSSRAQASLQLTNQGRMLLENGRPDDAISMLERSVGLDPTNGRSYYFLSEAWLLKNNPVQAEELNRLAELYLKDNSDWLLKTTEQRERIDRLKGQPSE